MQRCSRPCVARGFFTLALLLLLVAPVAGQQPTRHAEILRGRVVSDSGAVAVGGADVVVTMAPDRVEQATRTDSTGHFELRFPNGTGDYLVHVTLLGWEPWRRRVTRVGADSVLTVDVRLKAHAVALAPVNVKAERQKPGKNEPGFTTSTGADDRVVAGVNGAVDPTLQGDLAAMAATIPGVNAVPGGVSVLGLAPSQNNATLNGMAFSGSDIPREARAWTHVATSSFDPENGGFSGAQLAVNVPAGNIFTFWSSHLTLDAPALEYTDPVAARVGQRYTNLQASLGSNGELVRDRYYFNAAGQASRRLTDATSLLNAGDAVLQPAGVAPDSVARFLQLLSAAGVPASAGALSSSLVTTTGSFIGRLDHTPEADHTWGLTAYGKLSRADAPLSPLATRAHGGSSSSALGMLQAEHAFYFGDNYLNLARSALTLSANRTQPLLRLPDGRVLVGSNFGDGSGGFATLAFGGNSSMNTDDRAWTWETTDEVQWFNRNSRHKFKLYGESRLDGYDRSTAGNLLGSYSYNSLADFAANRPASYSRVLSAPAATGGEWSGVLAAGDLWRARPNLSLLYGARLEANRFTSAPALNPDVLSTFGARTDVAPGGVDISPRLGFSWKVGGGRDANRVGIMMSQLGTRILSPSGVIRGGIGEFRQLLPPALLAGAMSATGLPGATQQLLCVGPAVPVPDWSALAGGTPAPAACADGSNAFVDTSPTVRLFDREYGAARSWRANLGWASQIGGIAYSVDAIGSLNLAQPGAVDLNFAGTPRFSLADEGGRPVYVSPTSIVPGTGAVSPLEARRSDAFGRVLAQRSDLRGSSRQLSFTAYPSGFGRYLLTLSYTLAKSDMRFRGFDGYAFGDPARIETAPGDYDIRHQLQIQAGYSLPWLNLSLFGVVSSGRPFTPSVGGDVNGDGVAGDRAFVFDPAHASDPAVAAGMRALLATSPAGVRDCLQRQLGQPAARNSCRGPWTADLRGQVALGNRFPGAGHRVHAALNFTNLLGGLDQLLHGSAGLHGWGTPALPDPVLYNVRGFDPTTDRFRYEVNPRFGDTRPGATTFRVPFRATLDISIDLGKSMDKQQLERNMAPGRAGQARPSAARLRSQYAHNVLDVYAQILEQSDSLLLSPAQTQALNVAHARYRVQMDSLWTDLAQYLVALPASYDEAAALKRQQTAVDKGWEITWEQRTAIKSILTPLQLRMIPQFVATILNSEKVPHIRIFIRRQ